MPRVHLSGQKFSEQRKQHCDILVHVRLLHGVPPKMFLVLHARIPHLLTFFNEL